MYRRLDELNAGFQRDSPEALERHNRRKKALHEVFDHKKGMKVLDWGATDDTQSHEFVEIIIGVAIAKGFEYVVVPGLKFLAQKLAEKAVDKATSEAVKAIVSWLRPKQKEKKILDIIITLPDGTQIAVDQPDRSATINIRLANGQIESTTTYATRPSPLRARTRARKEREQNIGEKSVLNCKTDSLKELRS